MGWNIFHWTNLLKTAANLAFNTSRNRVSVVSLGNLFQCLFTLIVMNFLLMCNLKSKVRCLGCWSVGLCFHGLKLHLARENGQSSERGHLYSQGSEFCISDIGGVSFVNI